MAAVPLAGLSVYCSAPTVPPNPKKAIPSPPATASSSSPIQLPAASGYGKHLPPRPLPLKATEPKQLLPRLGEAAVSAYRGLLNACVERVFHFSDQPWLPSQRNFAPVDEISEEISLTEVDGEVPHDFPNGVYMMIGSNPMFGALQSTSSIFGKSSECWVEGEGMIHAIYFKKNVEGKWAISYNNRYVESETYKMEKEQGKPLFLPPVEGDPAVILASSFLNQIRFGKPYKDFSNTNIFEHSGKYYAIAENHLPQEINILNLDTVGGWNVKGWNRPFGAHPKKAPKTGELVFMGVDALEPYAVLGIISADGKELLHKVDLHFSRCSLSHDMGVTERYNIILDMPLIMDINRVIKGGPLIKYEKDCYARIGVMLRYGNANSVKWFQIDACCLFHILNCYEEEDEVVVQGFSANGSMIPGPDLGINKFKWFSDGFKKKSTINGKSEESIEGLFLSRLREWRLNMKTGKATDRYLTGQDTSMEFPMVNEMFIGLRNNYGYAQVGDLTASSECAKAKFGSLAKLYLKKKDTTMSQSKEEKGHVKIEYYRLDRNQYCSGAAFVSKQGRDCAEDDGWLICFVHSEDTNTSQVHIIDCKRFSSGAVAKLSLPTRVPYGFHGAFFHRPAWTRD